MKDFFGQELEVGDVVAVTEPNYRNLVKATVVKFTPQRVVLALPGDSSYTTPSNFVIKTPSKKEN